MERLFLTVLNMSLAASYVIAALLLLRLLLKKAPRRYSYALWSAAAFRLCCPVSFSAGFSLFGLLDLTQKGAALDFVPENLGLMAQPAIRTGMATVNMLLADALPAATPTNSVNPMQIWIFVGACVWLAGVGTMALYGSISYLRLRRRLRMATRLEDGVFASEAVRSPFVMGVLRPKIYLPYGLDGENRALVLAHEKCHLRHGDPLVRLFAYCLLALHWFNPLVWAAFFCMSRDMELRCDEKVLETGDARTYSLCLLSVAAGRRFPAPGPLAFGETDVKGRIRHALKWKKPRRWAAAAATVLCALTLLACTANPAQSGTLDGTYRAGEQLATHIAISYLPPDGEAIGIQKIEVSGDQVAITRDGEVIRATAEVSTVSRDALVQEMTEKRAITLGFDAALEMGWEDVSAVAEEIVPDYRRAKDMVVYRVRDQQSQESAQGYTLYFFRGEPLWFVLENYAVFKLEMIK